MKANQDMERIYVLLEKFEFPDLSEEDRNYVLSVMTTLEYNNMRATMKDTETVFSSADELVPDDSVYNSLIARKREKNTLIGFLKKPVQLYKAAASIIVLTGLFSFIHFTNLHEQNSNSLSNDTIIIYKTDTVYSRIVDTVQHIKEKMVYITQKKDPESTPLLFMTAENGYNCKKELYPADLDRIKTLAYNSKISDDTLFKN